VFDFYYQQGEARRRRFRVSGSVCTIGSARSNDLVIDTHLVGKRHAELELREDGVHIRDLGSLGGCWVNRERVLERGPLTDLDEIAVGDVSIVIEGGPRDESAVAGARPSSSSTRGRGAGVTAERPDSAPRRSVLGVLGFGGGWRERDAPERNAGRIRVDDAAPAATAGHPSGDGGWGVAARGSSPDGVRDEIEAEASAVSEEQLAYWGGIVHEQLLHQMDLRRKDVNRMSDEQLRGESVSLIRSIVDSLEGQLPLELDLDALRENVLNESVGLGPLEQFLADEEVTEIMVNNHREIFLEKAGRLERSRFRFSSEHTVYAVIERIITPIGRRIDESSPIVDARLKDGSRVNAIIPPLALKGPSLTIRKFPKHRLQFGDLVRYGSIDQGMVDFLRVCVEQRRNVIVSGGTGSGKTTLLNVLSNFIPEAERIVTIEDAAELKLVQPNLVALEARPSNLEGKGAVPIRDLVKNSLRMRPDRIVVGECRGGEALDMLQAMNTGHDGSLTTVHANNPRDVISRLEVLVLMAGMDLPVTAIREQVASAVDLIIQQTRFHCGSRKITKITEVVGVESGTVQLQDIFVYEQDGVDETGRVRGRFRPTGAIPTFYEALREIGHEVDLSPFSPSPTRF